MNILFGLQHLKLFKIRQNKHWDELKTKVKIFLVYGYCIMNIYLISIELFNGFLNCITTCLCQQMALLVMWYKCSK